MKKVLALAGILGALTLTGCALTSVAPDGEEKGDIVITEVDLQDGYYLSDKDDSYIHIEDGKIELCGYDIEGKTKAAYEACEGKKASLDVWLETAKEDYGSLFAWKEYTPVCFTKMGKNGEDFTLLVVDYEFASKSGSYTGYIVNEDGTITREENIYTYKGESLE